MEIRQMKRRDIGAVMKIMNDYIVHTTVIWERKEHKRAYFRRWYRAQKGRYPVFVADEDGEVLGYGALKPFGKSSGFDRLCENSIYFKKEAQGRGYGRKIMARLIEEAKQRDFWAMTAWIDDENRQSIYFHQSFGFYEAGELKKIGNKNGQRLTTKILLLDIQ